MNYAGGVIITSLLFTPVRNNLRARHARFQRFLPTPAAHLSLVPL